MLVGLWRKATPLCCWWDCRLGQPLWKCVKISQMEVPLEPAVPLLGILLEELKTSHHTNTYTPMFIKAQFVLANSWKLLKCPSIQKMGEKDFFVCLLVCF